MLTNKILLFEDMPEQQQRFVEELENVRGELDYKAVAFEWDSDAGGTFEKILTEALSGDRRPAVVVSDHDLSGMDGRLTDDVLEPVCQKLLIPLLRYAQRAPETDRDRFARHMYGDLYLIHLSIEDGANHAARDVAAHYAGFARLREMLSGSVEQDSFKEGPATVMADVLGRPELRVDLTLYANSGPQMLAKNAPAPDVENDSLSKATYNFGHWLLNSILRYPGILLNETSAAAYVNLDTNSFAGEEVQALFSTARYDGPFSRVRPYWWRSDVDAIIDDADVGDGLELAQSKGIDNVAPSRDPGTGEDGATYYCIVTRKPVTKENSIGNLSWVPQGADLARISSAAYETWAPLFNR